VKPSSPLLELFYDLRQYGFQHLDIDALALLLRALEGGYGLENIDAFERVCCLLWAKNQEQQEKLKRRMGEFRQALEKSRHQSASIPLDQQGSTNVSEENSIAEKAIKTQTDTTQKIEQNPAPKPSEIQLSPNQALKSLASVDKPEDIEAILSEQRPVRHPDYLPLSRRDMAKAGHSLRLMVRAGAATELDMEATWADYGRNGGIIVPVLKPPRIKNQAALLLCIDHDGSMVPFHIFGQRLLEAALEGRFSRTECYYFCNWPHNWLFHDPGHRDATPVDEVLARIDPASTCMVIFSDAGAARGGLSRKRIEATREFHRRARARAVRFCWLNPMPKSRWAGTSAGEIARFLPMVELSPSGLDAMTRILLGSRPGSPALPLPDGKP